MSVDERIDISDRIDVDKSDKSKECVLCHYWYFLDKNFNYGHIFVMDAITCKNVVNLKISLLFVLKKVHTELCMYISKR